MANPMDQNFISDMKLSRNELESFERLVNMAEKSEKSTIEFINSSELLAFTPAAALAVGVLNLAISVYTEYGIIATPGDLQHGIKRVIKKMCEIEESSPDNPSLDFYAALRKKIALAKKVK